MWARFIIGVIGFIPQRINSHLSINLCAMLFHVQCDIQDDTGSWKTSFNFLF